MNPVETNADLAQPARADDYHPLGLAPLLRAATAGADLTPVGEHLLAYSETHESPQALLDLALVLELKYQKDSALALQDLALRMRRLYRLKTVESGRPLRLLVLKAPGDLMTNTPFECLVDDADIQIEALYVDDALAAATPLPEHDLVLVAACASDANAAPLARAAELLAQTTAPVLNRPERVGATARDAAYALLGNVPGIAMARTHRVHRNELTDAASPWDPERALGAPWPLIVRPVGAHAGMGLARVLNRDELDRYVQQADADEFYVAPFIEYSDADGLYRKYRIVLIDGKPYACHMGVSRHWIVHYPYPEMRAHPERRQEEARFMAGFDTDFAMRHRDALHSIAALSGLDYIGMDCAETPDGDLLIFELATAMIIHDMDDTALFPYKQPQMRKVFDAFGDMLQRAASRPRATTATGNDR